MIDTKKCERFVKKVEEVLSISLADYGIINTIENLYIKDNGNNIKLCFKRNDLEELFVSFTFKDTDYLTINVYNKSNTFYDFIEYSNFLFNKKQKEVICDYLINNIKIYFEKQIELENERQDDIDTISNIFANSHIDKTLSEILKDLPNFRKMRTEVVTYKRELQKTDFGNPFQKQSKLFIDTVKGKVNVLTFNIKVDDFINYTLCEILSYKNNNQLLIKVVGGYVHELKIQYDYLYDLNKEQDIIKHNLEQMLVNILLTFIDKYSRNSENIPINNNIQISKQKEKTETNVFVYEITTDPGFKNIINRSVSVNKSNKEEENKEMSILEKDSTNIDCILHLLNKSGVKVMLANLIDRYDIFKEREIKLHHIKKKLNTINLNPIDDDVSKLLVTKIKDSDIVDCIAIKIKGDDFDFDVGELIFYEDLDNLIIKFLGGYVKSKDVSYKYLHQLDNINKLPQIAESLISTLDTIVSVFCRQYRNNKQHNTMMNITMLEKQNNDVNEKLVHNVEIGLNVSKEDGGIPFDFADRFKNSVPIDNIKDFHLLTEIQKDEILKKIGSKVCKLVRKEIIKNERIEKSKIPFD